MNIEKIKEENLCSGCGMCSLICPFDAIRMKNDERGFSYPTIDATKCTGCGVCLKNCHSTKSAFKNKFVGSYILRNKNILNLIKSQSGGAFYIIAKQFILAGGCVFGCTANKNGNTYHIKIQTIDELDLVLGSKYIQSDLKKTFLECLDLLKEKKPVLFSGTPCQISSLLNFLNYKKAPTKNLFTCDLICHGVGSPDVWKTYLNYLSKRFSQEIISYRFRDKNCGWLSHCESFTFANNKTVYETGWNEIYVKNLVIRDCCFKCKYTSLERVSDITLGDAWGIENQFSNLDMHYGWSILLINTIKGEEIFNKIIDNAVYVKNDNFDLFAQKSLKTNITLNDKGNGRFWRLYGKRKRAFAKKYFPITKKDYFIRRFSRKIRCLVKKGSKNE